MAPGALGESGGIDYRTVELHRVRLRADGRSAILAELARDLLEDHDGPRCQLFHGSPTGRCGSSPAPARGILRQIIASRGRTQNNPRADRGRRAD